MLRFGFAKAKFTANAIYHQILVVQVQAAVKADALKVQQHLAVVVTKEVENVVENAEAATVNKADKAVVIAEEALEVPVAVTHAAAQVVRAVQIARVVVAREAAVVVPVVETDQADQERDNN